MESQVSPGPENTTDSPEPSSDARPEDTWCKNCGAFISAVLIDRSFLREPPRWLPPIQPCDRCRTKDAASIASAEIFRLTKEKIEKAFKTAQASPKFRERTFAAFESEKTNSGPAAFASRYFPNGEGILFYGPCGVGKTHLASAIANKYAENINFLFVSCPELLNKIRRGFDSGADLEALEAAKTVPFLILDDIGAEKPTEWVRETLYILVDYRSEHKLSTVFTTNCSPNELADRLGDRIASRIIGMCQVIKMDGPDFRLRGKR